MSEREIKLHVEPGRSGRLLDALGHRRMRRSTLSAIYFDTPDLLLSRHRFALRLRSEDGRWVQTLKGGKDSVDDRLEDEVPISRGGQDAGVPALDIDRHRGSKVGRGLRALLKRHGRPALEEVWRTEVTRACRVLRARGTTVEWALDEGEVTAAGRSQPISELELELKSGDAAGLHALAHDWQALHGLWIDPVSKSQRGVLLRADAAFDAPVKAKRAPWSARQARALGGAAMLRCMVQACLAQILPNAGEIARGSRDPEHVHQLRVGLRRLRSAARGMKPFATRLPEGLEAAIMPVFEALGEARDQHVLSTTIAPQLHEAGAIVDAGGPSEEEAKHLRQLVRGAAFQSTLLHLMAFAGVHDDEDEGHADKGAGLECLVRALRKLARQVARDAVCFEALAFARQHRVRKRLKRLRYLAEFAAPAFDRGDVEAWLRQVSPAQDALGRHIDLVLASQRLASSAESGLDTGFAVGWLQAKSERSARAARKSLQRLREARRFW